MAKQYQTISIKDFGAGIDQQSSENQLQEGYCEDLVNCDPKPEGYLAKRTGYEGFCGNLPLRVKEYTYDNGFLCFTFDEDIDLSSERSSPILVYGQSSQGDGDFPNTAETLRYYDGYTLVSTKTDIPAGSTVAVEDKADTSDRLIWYARSTSQLDNSNVQVLPEENRIKAFGGSAPFTLTGDINNSTSNLIQVYTYNVKADYITSSSTNIGTSGGTVSIPGTPDLAAFDASIEVRVYRETGGDYVEILPDTVRINRTTRDIEIEISNDTGSPFDVTTVLKALPINNVTSQSVAAAGGTSTVSISGLTSDFPYFAIFREPSTANITGVAGSVFTLENSTDNTKFKKDETVQHSDNSATYVVTDASIAGQITVTPAITGAATGTVAGVQNTKVFPDEISVDATTKTADIKFTNSGPAGASFLIYYDFATVQVNKICVVEKEVPGDFLDTNPQLSVWGIPHYGRTGLNYIPEAGGRAAWANHIDSYRSAGETYVVSGLGGNLFREGLQSEFGSTYNLPTRFADIESTIASSQRVGPAFWTTGTPGVSRTRGYLTADDIDSSNRAIIESIEYQSGNTVRYTFKATNKVVVGKPLDVTAGTPADPANVNSDPQFEDYVTITGASLERHNGVLRILDADLSGTDSFWLDVENLNVDSTDFDITADAGGFGAVLTDEFTFTSASEFLAGDILQSNFFTATQIFTVRTSNALRVKADGPGELVDLPVGLIIKAKRTGSVVPLQQINSTQDVEGFLKGDMVKYTDYDRLFKIVSVNPNFDYEGCSITAAGGVATVTLPAATLVGVIGISGTDTFEVASGEEVEFTVGETIIHDDDDEEYIVIAIPQAGGDVQVDRTITGSGGNIKRIIDTAKFDVGSKVLLVQAGIYEGEQTITAITGLDTFTFATSEIASQTATIRGKTIELDESVVYEDTASFTKSFSVPKRWIPIESPTDSQSLTPQRYISYFNDKSYTNQGFLRSVMVSDNMYFTNSDDSVYKYDGLNNYRAGLFRWQPHLFASIATAPTGPVDGKVSFSPTSTAINSTLANVLTVDSGAEAKFTVGNKVQVSYPTEAAEEFLITGLTDGEIELDGSPSISPETPDTITRVNRYRYYFRLNAIDANNNLIGSAVTGADDFVVELSESAQVRVRLVGMPVWDVYDYDKLEVNVYRTQANSSGPFYFLFTIPMQFDQDRYGYIDFKDTTADNLLTDLDEISTALKGAELGTQFSEPMRAKYITSAGNRLILANVKDYPEVNIQLYDTGAPIDVATLNAQVWQFRRDSESVATGTDDELVSNIAYEFTDTSVAVTLGTHTSTSFTISGTVPADGEWVYLFHSAPDTVDDNVEFCGWWKVGAGGVVAWNNAPASPTGTLPDRMARATTVGDWPIFLGDDYNYLVRNGNRDADISYQFVAMRRLANAINVSQRYSSDPWLIANAGNEFRSGQLIVRSPKVLTTIPEVEIPTHSGFSIYVNNILRSSGNNIPMQTVTYPSRLIASGPNFAEIFDNPRALLDTESESAVDVNSADGQEITGVIPFFGESAFGAAQKDAVLVVFKENSIYLVNLAAKAQGLNAVQKIESQGLGCTAPYSIASTRDGIMFANESGIFRLTRDLRIEYIGQKVERIWQDGEVNLDQLSIAQGTHYALGRQYKLSIPKNAETVNEEILVYNHTREYRGKGFGAWSRYDNHFATGWANLKTDAYFASSRGQVFRLRNEGSETDYRDDSSAYTMEALFRALDFGDTGRRKTVSKVLAQFRNADDQQNTKIFSAPDLRSDFTQVDDFKIVDNGSGVGDSKVATVAFSPNRRKGVYFQLKMTNTSKDEIVEVAGLDFRVAGLTGEGITEAAQTTKK